MGITLEDFHGRRTSGSNYYRQGLLGCLENPSLCIFTFLAPCVVHGLNSEAVGENFYMCCLGYCFLPPVAFVLAGQVREKIRIVRNISGSLGMDLVISFFCPCCALVQDRVETIDMVPPGERAEVVEKITSLGSDPDPEPPESPTVKRE